MNASKPTIAAVFKERAAAQTAMDRLLEMGADKGDLVFACRKDWEAPAAADLGDLELGGMGSAYPDLRPGGKGDANPFIGGTASQDREIAAAAGAASDPGRMSDFLWGMLPASVAERIVSLYDQGRTIVIVANATAAIEAALREAGAGEIVGRVYLPR